MDFLLEMSERQISANEFFGNILLDSIERNFGLKNVRILCFDTHNNFLSWTDRNGILVNSENHPYNKFSAIDIIGHMIYRDAVRDDLNYFNVTPRIYKSTDIIGTIDYDHSAYARFLEESLQAHYSVTLALGINAYIQIMFLKTREEGDFTDEEMEELNRIYVYVANSYKNFKKHEQAKIVSAIQDEVIASGERAYLITDDFMHIISYNNTALNYLKELFGPAVAGQLATVPTAPCTWLSFLLDGAGKEGEAGTHIVRDYIFKSHTYDQGYSHGIIDRYHWVTVSKRDGSSPSVCPDMGFFLTQKERRVAELLCGGYTYQAIAEELVISYHTVKNHVQNIYSKCGVKNRFQLCKLLEENK